jgi:hypothetical protein
LTVLCSFSGSIYIETLGERPGKRAIIYYSTFYVIFYVCVSISKSSAPIDIVRFIRRCGFSARYYSKRSGIISSNDFYLSTIIGFTSISTVSATSDLCKEFSVSIYGYLKRSIKR